MKKSEREALKKAFNIPEPERKEDFVALYNEKIKKNDRKFNTVTFFRYASTVAFAVLLVGLWGHLSNTADFRGKFDISERPSTTTQVTLTQATEQSRTTDLHTLSTEISTAGFNYNVPALTNPPLIDMPDSPDYIPPESIPQAPVTKPSHSTSKITFTTKTVTTTKRTTSAKTTTIPQEDDNLCKPTLPTTTQKLPEIVPATTTAVEAFTPEITSPSDSCATAVPTTSPVTMPTYPSTDNCSTGMPTTEPASPNFPDGVEVASKYNVVYPTVVYHKSYPTVSVDDFFDWNTENEQKHTTFRRLKRNSQFIVEGTIQDIIYTEVYGKPYTQENILISQTYKGDAMPSCMISVYIPGGYMPMSEFSKKNNVTLNYPDNYTVYDSGGNKGTQQVGDRLIFFLNKAEYPIKQTAFQLTETTDISIFRQSGESYISIGDPKISFTIDSLLK